MPEEHSSSYAVRRSTTHHVGERDQLQSHKFRGGHRVIEALHYTKHKSLFGLKALNWLPVAPSGDALYDLNCTCAVGRWEAHIAVANCILFDGERTPEEKTSHADSHLHLDVFTRAYRNHPSSLKERRT